jgi:fructosamine-3-kinase
MSLAEVAAALKSEWGVAIDAATARAVAGGSINSAWQVSSDRGPVFLKTNRRAAAPMFAAEVDGLQALAAAGCVAVPSCLAHGVCASGAYLLMSRVDLSGSRSAAAARMLGRQLAQQHRKAWDQFGWHQDNFIGSTAQPNPPDDDWCRFFQHQRLGFQLQLARENGFPAVQRPGAALLAALPGLLSGHHPTPSLLHGDLSGGNWGASRVGIPWLFDPAVYCGDREADLAMTQLFGGFPSAFYEAYEAEWPLSPGWQQRFELYNLYHVLNHLNLFGGGYLGQALESMERLLGL